MIIPGMGTVFLSMMLSGNLSPAGMEVYPPFPAVVQTAADETCVNLLRNAMQEAGSFFVKVHAAEALINNNYPEGIATVFLPVFEGGTGREQIGAARVLAKLYQQDKERQAPFLDQIVKLFLTADSTIERLVALESLAKLGYKKPLPEIRKLALDGETGFKLMALWTLSNSGTAEDEAALATMLNAADPLAYRYAGYALRFMDKIRPSTYELLKKCASRIPANDANSVYVWSAWYVHALPEDSTAARKVLLTALAGAAGMRYEVAEALSLRGSMKDDQLLLKQLLADEVLDVQVAAANAKRRILSREGR
ncbi:HEAT repeat domain-containing protein [Chitinophaga defluvii]|uniref:HEAT repeat domain-containing protein n=1 Tax=Chitinophaga defluvii TaxID=3163343 RepID=A0ABV2SZ29_9BACT